MTTNRILIHFLSFPSFRSSRCCDSRRETESEQEGESGNIDVDGLLSDRTGEKRKKERTLKCFGPSVGMNGAPLHPKTESVEHWMKLYRCDVICHLRKHFHIRHARQHKRHAVIKTDGVQHSLSSARRLRAQLPHRPEQMKRKYCSA